MCMNYIIFLLFGGEIEGTLRTDTSFWLFIYLLIYSVCRILRA